MNDFWIHSKIYFFQSLLGLSEFFTKRGAAWDKKGQGICLTLGLLLNFVLLRVTEIIVFKNLPLLKQPIWQVFLSLIVVLFIGGGVVFMTRTLLSHLIKKAVLPLEQKEKVVERQQEERAKLEKKFLDSQINQGVNNSTKNKTHKI